MYFHDLSHLSYAFEMFMLQIPTSVCCSLFLSKDHTSGKCFSKIMPMTTQTRTLSRYMRHCRSLHTSRPEKDGVFVTSEGLKNYPQFRIKWSLIPGRWEPFLFSLVFVCRKPTEMTRQVFGSGSIDVVSFTSLLVQLGGNWLLFLCTRQIYLISPYNLATSHFTVTPPPRPSLLLLEYWKP